MHESVRLPDNERFARIETGVSELKSDIAQIHQALKEISEILRSIATLEVKHHELKDAVTRAHKRGDDHDDRIRGLEIGAAANGNVKELERRLGKVEIAIGRNAWVERVVWAIILIGLQVVFK